ncbi:MAG: SH3 domain-containing protein [Anaerolineae bacterium]|nr:SH3 domain-containing protein [Anaerolineae bacterium]
MRKLILFLFFVAFYKPLAAQTDACAGLVTPRLAAEATGRVMADDGIGLVLRDAPTTSSQILMNLPEGIIFTALESPTCADNFIWYKVRLADGREGYLAEGGVQRYYVEPYAVGVHLLQEDNTRLQHYFVDSRGSIQLQSTLEVIPRTGTGLWQQPEVVVANQVLQDRRTNCPHVLPPELPPDLSQFPFEDNQRQFYASLDGQKILVFRHYTIPIPDCANQVNEQYGTTYISLLDANGEQELFPFSQHSDPPPSTFCYPPIVFSPEQRTFVDEVVWSPDRTYVGLVVRYLRDGQNFPCAFYHIFLVNTQTLEISYLDSGRRLAWAEGGRRLWFARVERIDPNEAGIERLFSVQPNGSNKIEYALPPEITLLPDELDRQEHNLLPWDSGSERILVCVDTCERVRTLTPSIMTFTPIVEANASFRSVHYVAGDTHLLWLSADGKVYLQSLEGSLEEIPVGQPIVEVQSAGIGVLLRSPENRYFYCDISTRAVKEVLLNTTP